MSSLAVIIVTSVMTQLGSCCDNNLIDHRISFKSFSCKLEKTNDFETFKINVLNLFILINLLCTDSLPKNFFECRGFPNSREMRNAVVVVAG